MSKVTIPEPVTVWKRDCGYRNATNLPVILRDGETFITTDQAEAYAAARVREALENAAKVCDEQAMSYERSTENCDGDPTDISELRSKAWVVSNLARRIRFLIPK